MQIGGRVDVRETPEVDAIALKKSFSLFTIRFRYVGGRGQLRIPANMRVLEVRILSTSGSNPLSAPLRESYYDSIVVSGE